MATSFFWTQDCLAPFPSQSIEGACCSRPRRAPFVPSPKKSSALQQTATAIAASSRDICPELQTSSEPLDPAVQSFTRSRGRHARKAPIPTSPGPAQEIVDARLPHPSLNPEYLCLEPPHRSLDNSAARAHFVSPPPKLLPCPSTTYNTLFLFFCCPFATQWLLVAETRTRLPSLRGDC
jgi:hypothetical protein